MRIWTCTLWFHKRIKSSPTVHDRNDSGVSKGFAGPFLLNTMVAWASGERRVRRPPALQTTLHWKPISCEGGRVHSPICSAATAVYLGHKRTESNTPQAGALVFAMTTQRKPLSASSPWTKVSCTQHPDVDVNCGGCHHLLQSDPFSCGLPYGALSLLEFGQTSLLFSIALGKNCGWEHELWRQTGLG
jgi:hypothetical protein